MGKFSRGLLRTLNRAAPMWRQGLLPSAAALGPATARYLSTQRTLRLSTSVGFTSVDLVLTELEPGLSALCAVTAPKSHAKGSRGWQKVISMG